MGNLNPWLEITKQEEINKPGINGEIFSIEFPKGWVAEMREKFKNLCLGNMPQTPDDEPPDDDLEIANELIECYGDNDLSNFMSILLNLYIDLSETDVIWEFIRDNDPNEYELLNFLYEKNYLEKET